MYYFNFNDYIAIVMHYYYINCPCPPCSPEAAADDDGESSKSRHVGQLNAPGPSQPANIGLCC